MPHKRSVVCTFFSLDLVYRTNVVDINKISNSGPVGWKACVLTTIYVSSLHLLGVTNLQIQIATQALPEAVRVNVSQQ